MCSLVGHSRVIPHTLELRFLRGICWQISDNRRKKKLLLLKIPTQFFFRDRSSERSQSSYGPTFKQVVRSTNSKTRCFILRDFLKEYNIHKIILKKGIPVSYTHLDVYKRQLQTSEYYITKLLHKKNTKQRHEA